MSTTMKVWASSYTAGAAAAAAGNMRVSSRMPPAAKAVARRLLAAPHTVQQQQQARQDVTAHFFSKFRTDSQDAGIYGSQGRDDFTADDVEHYFNYMGMLAVEGTYDRMEEMMASGLDPVDVLLLMAASENDVPKVEELLAAGANVNIADNAGKSPLELATKPEAKALIETAAKKAVSA